MAQPLPSHSQDGYDLIKNIREWQSRQQDIPPGGGDGEEALEYLEVSRLSANLLLLFKEIILLLRQQVAIPKDARISLERSCSALILWSDGYGIAQGRLNDIFKRSSKLRYTLLKNLSRLGRALTERLIPLADISSEKLQQLCSSVESSIGKASSILNEELCRQGDDASSDAGSTFSDDNIHEVAEDLKTDTHVLSSLDSIIKHPVFDLQNEDAVEDYAHSTWSPEKFFVDAIVNRFPLLDRSLASRLGQTNYERYLRCQADREALDNKEGVTSIQQEEPEVAGTIITKSKFHDSGVGTSIAPTVVRPETVMGYSRKDQSVRIPPLPKGAKAGMPFSCTACSRTVVITNNLDWKQVFCTIVYSNEVSEDGSQLGGSDNDSENPQESSHPNAKGKGKLTAIAENDPINEKWNNLCSTLFVYNLPSEVSEEELKAVFSKQQGYKRVFSKATQNFPLSFVEFDSTSSAMKAVLDLHGKPQSLKNGKGSVFLSFATNFLSQISELRTGDGWSDSGSKPSLSEDLPLPPGWAIFNQEKTHRLYYYNSETNVTRWQQPLFNPVYDPPPNMPPIHQEWTPLFEHAHQQWLYVNRETGRMQWEAPVINPVYHPPSNRPPIPPGWIPLYDHRHQRWYYVNQETGRTQWDAPGITQVALKEAAEKSAQEAKEQVVIAEEGQTAVISTQQEELMAASVAKKEKGDELLRENQHTIRVSTAKAGGEPSAQEEERAAREETRVLREEARVLREELQALREGIRAAQEAKQTARDENQTTQETKEQTTSETEKQAKDLSPSGKSP
ncbi:hypothetical protein ACHAPV_002492 [Trichoderma viride]